MGEYNCTVLAGLGLVACLNREPANRTKPPVGYLWDLKADQEKKKKHLAGYVAGMFLQ